METYKHLGIRINATLINDVKLCQSFIEMMRNERYARYEVILDVLAYNGYVIYSTCLAEDEGYFFNSLTNDRSNSLDDASLVIDASCNRSQLIGFIEYLNENFSPMGNGMWLSNHSADTEFSHSQIVNLFITKKSI